MRRNVLLLSALVVMSLATRGSAHCQIPCGIYNDPARFVQMREHIRTIEKSMKKIVELGTASEKNDNQIVRWVNNKEQHADKLTEIVTYYFMAQRVTPAKPDDEKAYAKYTGQLVLLHRMVYRAMKAKQTTDLEHVTELRKLVDTFEASYLGKAAAGKHGHGHEHK